MLLVLEIFLTVIAWRKGWKGWALLPTGITMLFGILLGAAVEAPGGSPQAAYPVAFLADLGNVAVLVGLSTRAPRHIQPQEIAAPATPINVPADSTDA